MIYFYTLNQKHYFVVMSSDRLPVTTHQKLNWLFGQSRLCQKKLLEGQFIGPRKEMITPWSTNAVEITQNMGIQGILRIEELIKVESKEPDFDPMLQQIYENPGQDLFDIDLKPEPIRWVKDIAAYNREQSLALSHDEIIYLESISKKIKRPLSDSEIYGFAQINSEHCRHKIFNGSFVIDGQEMPDSLFALIKKTSKAHPQNLVSAYKDNVAFVLGPQINQFAPKTQDKADFFEIRKIDSVLSLKAETHNFPTTVEPFNGAATGSGGEIRDRMAGGKGSIPLAGTAVYMTSYPRFDQTHEWKNRIKSRNWLYHSPSDILIKASNGASDFGNKFGQPLINGSLFTFEHEENNKIYAYDKVIMMAGGIGYANRRDSIKEVPQEGDVIVVLGGDNYRIGMGGGAVSSVATGEYGQGTELNAVQRANPEMQKRVANAIRAMTEEKENPIISIHDHGAGGHLNSLSELVEETGAQINIDRLPLGDPTLSFKEILGNESQERMGLVIKKQALPKLKKVAARERSPLYEVGEVKSDKRLLVKNNDQSCPVDLKLEYLFGKPPKTVLTDTTQQQSYAAIHYDLHHFDEYLFDVLRLESVACKDWLTNKVDRSVGGRVAMQQCAGPLQLPLNNVGVMALDFEGEKGMATAIGHAPAVALIDAEKASRLAIAEALTNLIWAPIEGGLSGVSLSANWMWPARQKGENARLYAAVKAASDCAIALGIPIPTGKDSLSMTQKYPDGKTVFAPGTLIISAAGPVSDIKKSVSPVLNPVSGTHLIYIGFTNDHFELGGSGFAQTLNKLGNDAPDITDLSYFKRVFNTVQQLIKNNEVLAGHDVSAGGLITTLLEMNFANCDHGMDIQLDDFEEDDLIKILFSESPALVIQVDNPQKTGEKLQQAGIHYHHLGKVIDDFKLKITHQKNKKTLDLTHYRDIWYETSHQLDLKQTRHHLAHARFKHYKHQDLKFHFHKTFSGLKSQMNLHRTNQKPATRAAIIREKGVNGDREMAYALHLAGFNVKDIHMTDLISGKEDLSDVGMIVFVGGFSNSDVLGSAKGWAGAFLYNPKAKQALDRFYQRDDTLSLGICNGCQLMTELGLIYPEHPEKPKMTVNESGKFESGFINVNIHENDTVMLKSLSGSRLGVWVAHGEGKFSFPYYRDKYCIPVSYSYDQYPGNPNGSDWSAAAICSNNGRHLAMMPHLERAIFPWQWANYPENRKKDELSPWIEAFINARLWLENQ